jgi:hypothetical protein
MEIRKVPASAGAEWLLGAFLLLRRSPFGLGMLGLIYGLLAIATSLIAQVVPPLALPLQFLLMLVGPLLLAGMVFAAREVDEGRSAAPHHLLRGIQEGKAGRLIGTLIPQMAALLVCVLLLVAVVGIDQLQALSDLMQKLQTQANPDPAIFEGLPLGRLLLWTVLVIGVGIFTGFFTFTALPDMMFADIGLFPAMRRSFQACLRNLPALIVMSLLMVVVVFALMLGITVVSLLAQLIGGQTAMMVVSNLLMTMFLAPMLTSAMYFAWKQMLGGGATTTAAEPSGVAM